jgi:predicted PurR-regulated permease PerM
LADSEGVQRSALRFVPQDAGLEIIRLGGAVDRALRSYVRGQAIVCVVTGASVALGLTLLHHPAALLLGLVAGAAEVIPYLGFLITAIAITLAGSSVNALQAALGLMLYVGINWTIGTFVTPRVMGRYLKMHPFVVTVSVLAGALLMGPAGALLALPGAAVLQAVIGELAPAPAAGGRL